MLLDRSDRERIRITENVQATRQWLLGELSASADGGELALNDPDNVTLQSVMARRAPEVCAMLSQTLLSVSQYDGGMLVELFYDHPWFRTPALVNHSRKLEQLWCDYLPYLHNWRDWEPLPDPNEDNFGINYEIRCFKRASDDECVADFVSLARRSTGDGATQAVDNAVERDADQVFHALHETFGCTFIGLRLFTPTSDGVQVDWWTPPTTQDSQLSAVNSLNP